MTLTKGDQNCNLAVKLKVTQMTSALCLLVETLNIISHGCVNG